MGEAAQHRERRWRRLRAALAAAGLVLLGGPVLAPAAVAADGSSASSRYPAQVAIDSISPVTAQVGGTVTLSGTVTNTGTSALHGLRMGVRGGQSSLLRSDIEAVAQRTTPVDADRGEWVADDLHQQVGTLAPKAHASFTLHVKLSEVGIVSDGVYWLGVDAVDTNGEEGIARTFVPVSAPNSVNPTKIATLWPLTSTPVVQAQTFVDSQGNEQPVLTDDGLAADLGPNGRLGQLASLGRQYGSKLDLTWVVDPDLINTVTAMTGKYQVATGNDTQGASADCDCIKNGTGGDAASAWFLEVQKELAGQQVIALPYGDPDLASIAHGKGSAASLASLLKASNTLGLDRLQITADRSVAWPYQGYVDPSIVSLATSMGAHTVIASSDSISDDSTLNYTPNAARPIGKGTTAVVADGSLSDLFEGSLSTPSAQSAAEQQFLAETLAIGRERNTARSILVAPPRDLSAGAAQTLVRSLQAAQADHLAVPASFDSVAGATPTPGASTHVPSRSQYPKQIAASQLDALPNTVNVQTQITLLEKVLTVPSRLRDPFSAAIMRSVSTQWRDRHGANTAYLNSMNGYLQTELDAVHILNKSGAVTLPGGHSSGKIAISVANNLQQNVTGLQLQLTSHNSTRLRVKGDSVQQVAIDAGGTKKTFRFSVKALANGEAKMTAQLYTSDGQQFGPPETVTVKVTSVSTGVIAVVSGGGLLVLLAAFRLYWKRKKNAAEQQATS